MVSSPAGRPSETPGVGPGPLHFSLLQPPALSPPPQPPAQKLCPKETACCHFRLWSIFKAERLGVGCVFAFVTK